MQLTNLPRGSGEVELMGLLPIFYVYDYIEQSEQWGKIKEFDNNILLKRKLKQGRSCFYTTLKKIIPGLSKYDKSKPVIFTHKVSTSTGIQIPNYSAHNSGTCKNLNSILCHVTNVCIIYL